MGNMTKNLADRIEELYVEPYPGRKGTERVYEDCGRCLGTGVYDGPSAAKFYTSAVGYETTGCFSCWGEGRTSRLVSSARGTARRRARQEANREAYLAENGERLRREAEERAEAERKAEEAEAAAHAAIPAIEEGRYVVAGELLTTKLVDNPFSPYGGATLKMLVKLDTGAKIWGSFPSGLSGAERGDRVTFTAAIEPSRDDHAFGFFKRPTKASIVE